MLRGTCCVEDQPFLLLQGTALACGGRAACSLEVGFLSDKLDSACAFLGLFFFLRRTTIQPSVAVSWSSPGTCATAAAVFPSPLWYASVPSSFSSLHPFIPSSAPP
ncbi:hypothetical protein E2C01_065698 [Portunus trituberculatus]|uniref:Uncharacterized protein n=1 Tax=Portunus trituberculatus TaxID=210409 RepID=A0A5B7HJK0_PORTR|nr:hypothetical protein [Portunus trituberculatus]